MAYKIYRYIFPNGKYYIGKTKTTIEQRAGSNGCRYNDKTLVGRAIRKYGWINVKKEILFDGLSEKEANQKERDLIRQYNTTDYTVGYNLTRGGDGGQSIHRVVSEETKRKIGIANSQKLKGRKVPEEQVVRMRTSLLGHIVTEETREKIRKANTGKHHTEETKRKISEINRNRDPEILKKISVSLRKSGKQRAEKRRQTMKEKYPNGFNQSAEANLKRSQALKGIKRSEETKAKMRKPKSSEAIENMKKAQQLRRMQEQQLTNVTGGR